MKKLLFILSIVSLFISCDNADMNEDDGIPAVVSYKIYAIDKDGVEKTDGFSIYDIIYMEFTATDSKLDINKLCGVWWLDKYDLPQPPDHSIDLPQQISRPQAYSQQLQQPLGIVGPHKFVFYLVDNEGNKSETVTSNVINMKSF